MFCTKVGSANLFRHGHVLSSYLSAVITMGCHPVSTETTQMHRVKERKKAPQKSAD